MSSVGGTSDEELEALVEDFGTDNSTSTPTSTPPAKLSRKQKALFIFAGCCLLVACSTWLLMAELLQGLQSGKHKFQKPFFLSYVIHGSYIVFLIPWVVYPPLWKSFPILKKTAKIAAPLSLILFAVSFTWYISLPRTLVSANTAIYNSASIFVFVFSAIFLQEKVTALKVVSVLISVFGVVIVSLASEDQSTGDVHSTFMGYVCVFVSTVLYSIYEVFFKKLSSDPKAKERGEEHEVIRRRRREVDHKRQFVEATQFLGLVGMWTLVLTWPGFFLMDATGWEVFEVPKGRSLEMVTLNCILDCFNNIAIVLGITSSTPLFMSVGSVVSIPTSFLADYLFHGYVLPPIAIIGVVAIVVAFIGLTMAQVRENSANGKNV